MKRSSARALLVFGLTASAALLVSCASSKASREKALTQFTQQIVGEYQSDAGAQLLVAAVRKRMIADHLLYVERSDSAGSSGRLVSLEFGEGKKINQRAMVFVDGGRWRNLRDNLDLFTALLPQDVKPAGTCDMKVAPDLNSVDYSCSGSPREIFRRK